MTIGSTIKKLRRERDITQEQLAEYLNLSPSAISQWETDRVMPDITQLPLLANIFDVSADVLLGIDIKNKQKDIEKIIDNAKDYSGKGYFSKSEAILRAGLSRYPSSERLMAALIFSIGRYPYSFEGGIYDEDTYSQIQAEIICICEKLLAESTDDTIRSDAIYKLCTTYPKVGRREDAIKLAESNPGRYLA